MTLTFYQVDAFTSKLFGGNPAAVVPLENWLDDSVLQNIAEENNLSETAFFVKKEDHYHIRWMTPVSEVPLCGHATLATAYVIFNFIDKNATKIRFESLSGDLFVTREGDLLSLDFPNHKPAQVPISNELKNCFIEPPLEVLNTNFYLLVVFESENYIREMKPSFESIRKLHDHAVIVSAKGTEVDFVSRMFAPNEGIDEDPVTGSAHSVLIPYWAEKLGKKNFRALQVSKRGGELFCELMGDRVKISGKGVLYATGSLYLAF